MRETKKPPLIELASQGRLGAYATEIETLVFDVLQRVGRRLGLHEAHQVSVLICDNPTIRRLNRRWRGIDRATDVLSFPLHELHPGQKAPEGALGDIVVALPTVRLAAAQLELDWHHHMAHLLIHGLLHLLGYDHAEDEQAEAMERCEKELLDIFGKSA